MIEEFTTEGLVAIIMSVVALGGVIITALTARHKSQLDNSASARENRKLDAGETESLIEGWNMLVGRLQDRSDKIDVRMEVLEVRNREQEADAVALAADVENRAKILAVAVDERSRQINVLEQDISTLQADQEMTKRELAKRDLRIVDLEERVKLLQSENAASKLEMEKLRKENRELKAALDVLKGAVS